MSKDSGPTGSGCLIILVLGIIIIGVIFMSGNPTTKNTPSNANDFKSPAVSMSKIAGTYVESIDGIKSITIKEVFSDSGMYGGWNGKIIFSPAIGDWVAQPRCRIYGTTLAMEIPTDGTIVKMFRIIDPLTIRCDLPPWKGTYIRK